jgi:hypothetical protein
LPKKIKVLGIFALHNILEKMGHLLMFKPCREFNQREPCAETLVHGGVAIAQLHYCYDCFAILKLVNFHRQHHLDCPLRAIYTCKLVVDRTPAHVLYKSPKARKKTTRNTTEWINK